MQTFPDDENGDVLRQMQESGDDLSLPRGIDFSVFFPGELEAQALRRGLGPGSGDLPTDYVSVE